MKCQNCGSEIKETAAFCSNCGSPIQGSSERKDEQTEATIGNSDGKKKNKLIGLSKKRALIILAGMCVIVIVELLFVKYIVPMTKYNHAQRLLDNKQYEEAYSILEGLDTFNNAPDAIKQGEFDRAMALCEDGEYDDGYAILQELGDFNNASEEILKSKYTRAIALIKDKKYESAYALLKEIAPYNDAENVINDSIYDRAISYKDEKNYEESYKLLKTIRGYTKKENGETSVDVDKEIIEVYALLVSSTLEKYEKNGQDGPALKYLRTASSDSDSSEDLKNLYDQKEKEYKAACIKKAQELFKESGHDAAINYLRGAKTYLPSDDKDLSKAIEEYENSKPSIPQELKQYETGLVYEGKTYRVSLDHDDWYINYRSAPDYIAIDESDNNILGKMKHGTEIFVEYIYDTTWAVFKKDNQYVFASLYSLNDPSKDRLLEVVQ